MLKISDILQISQKCWLDGESPKYFCEFLIERATTHYYLKIVLYERFLFKEHNPAQDPNCTAQFSPKQTINCFVYLVFVSAGEKERRITPVQVGSPPIARERVELRKVENFGKVGARAGRHSRQKFCAVQSKDRGKGSSRVVHGVFLAVFSHRIAAAAETCEVHRMLKLDNYK
ncbi:unnamed protein product [Hermetia illucens]|uniref:Uncharacterized protein n=1 Tax=Hermetia illucens TaxID=343691 RepID=A0A7R8UB42_HERIL|nr:unnamed protein product [Hermetia illucens]